MDFSRFDIVLITTMSIAIVSMSFVFPALGLAGDVEPDDVPEFEMEGERFDIAGDFPDRPGSPSGGFLTWTEDPHSGDSQIWIKRGDDGALLHLSSWVKDDEDVARLEFSDYVDGSVDDHEEIFLGPEEGDAYRMDDFGYVIQFDLVEIDGSIADDDFTFTVEWRVIEEPEDQGWLDRVPILGSVVSGGESVAGMVGWIGSILYWTFGSMFEVMLNGAGMLYDSASFMFGSMFWLIGTYTLIIANANSWAAIFVAIPGLLMSLEFVKMALILVSLLPTT